MQDRKIENQQAENDKSDLLKNWMMVALTLIFVFLYAAALFGWLKPLENAAMVTRLEPIIFVIIGYYFGRLPAQQNEKTLKDEITRQTQKADAAQQIKEKSQQEREVLEEKIKNARFVLTSTSNESALRGASENNRSFDADGTNGSAKTSVEMAIGILNS